MELPRPDWELAKSIQMQQNGTGLVLAVLALVYVVYVCRRDKVLYPIFIYIGTGLGSLAEPIVDYLGVSTFPEMGQTVLYTTFGRHMPPYITLCYLYYYTVPIVWLVRRMSKGISGQQWWKFYAYLTVFTTVFELYPIHLGLWRYYGPLQPPGILGFPAWWWFGQSSVVFTTAAIIFLLRRAVITEKLSFLFVAIAPMLVFTTLEGPALPISVALHSATEPSTTAVVQFLTIGLHLVNVWICGRIVSRGQLNSGA
jgi:hypothetical protein